MKFEGITLINLCPHAIDIKDILHIPERHWVARCKNQSSIKYKPTILNFQHKGVRFGLLNDVVRIYNTKKSEEGEEKEWKPFPPELPFTFYIVSQITADKLKDRNDILIPDSKTKDGELIVRGFLCSEATYVNIVECLE